MDAAPGTPGNPLSREEHVQRFWDCLAYVAEPAFGHEEGARIVAMIDGLEQMEDVGPLLAVLTNREAR